MTIRLSTLVIAAVFFAGCSKRPETSSPATQPVVEPATSNQPAVVQTSPAIASDETKVNSNPDLNELNRALRAWVLRNKRRPANFEEFAVTANIQIPSPPTGKKYEIGQHMHIMLVDQ